MRKLTYKLWKEPSHVQHAVSSQLGRLDASLRISEANAAAKAEIFQNCIPQRREITSDCLDQGFLELFGSCLPRFDLLAEIKAELIKRPSIIFRRVSFHVHYFSLFAIGHFQGPLSCEQNLPEATAKPHRGLLETQSPSRGPRRVRSPTNVLLRLTC